MGILYHDKITGAKTTSNKEEAWQNTQDLDLDVREIKSQKINIGVSSVAASTYTLLSTDSILHVTYTDTGTVGISIPTAQIIDGRVFEVVDAGNGASTYNITITPVSGNIQHTTDLVLNSNGQSVTLYCYGGNIFIK